MDTATEKKLIPVLSILFVADNDKQYKNRIRELTDEIGITDCSGAGAYNMGVRASVAIDGDSITLIAYNDGIVHVVEVTYSEHIDEGDGDEESYYFVGSNEDPDDTLLVVAIVRKYQYQN